MYVFVLLGVILLVPWWRTEFIGIEDRSQDRQCALNISESGMFCSCEYAIICNGWEQIWTNAAGTNPANISPFQAHIGNFTVAHLYI